MGHTRYDLFKKLEELCSLQKTGENCYNKMVQTGKLERLHDYGTGYLDISIFYFLDYKNRHCCRIWFGTIDDGDFGSWNFFDTKEKAIELVEKAAEIFKDIVMLPTYDELNELFRTIGIYFLNE